MSIKNLLRKAAELVVELPPEAEPETSYTPTAASEYVAPIAPTKSVEQIIRDEPGPNLDEIKIPTQSVAATAPAGQVDFATVYQTAGLPVVPFTAEQALDVIHSLPVELPIDARRATVQATLKAMGKAMGVSTEGVIADAGRKVAALSAYEDLLTHQTNSYIQTLESKIADLETLVAGHRAEIEKTKGLLGQAVERCDAESQRLDDVLEFFTLDSGSSRNA